MKVRVSSHGFTVLEVMIFLAVSAGLLVSTTLVLSGQQRKTQFTQAVREVESQIQDIINDVATGYYANTNNFTCSASGASGRPVIVAAASNTQGANRGCIFLGRAIQFAVNGTNESGVNIYNVVGRQEVIVGAFTREVKDLDQAVPTAIAPGSGAVPGTSTIPDGITSVTLNNGLRARRMYYRVGAVNTNIGAVAFLSNFGQYAPSGANLISGAQQVNLIPVVGSGLNNTSQATVDQIDSINNTTPVNPGDGVVICFDDGGGLNHAELTIGSSNRQLSTKLDIRNGDCP